MSYSKDQESKYLRSVHEYVSRFISPLYLEKNVDKIDKNSLYEFIIPFERKELVNTLLGSSIHFRKELQNFGSYYIFILKK